MTRIQLATLAVVSVFATAAVLAGGAGRSAAPAWLAAAPRTQPTVSSARPAAPAPAAAPDAPVASAPVASSPTPIPATSAPAPAQPATEPRPKAAAKPKPSKVGHIFVIALTGPGYQQTFGAQSPMPYLATDLRARGALLSGFHPLDGADLPNYLALAGGLKPNADTQANCATFVDGTCVQPNTTLSLGDQVTSSGRSWRAYLEGMGDAPCVHPEDGAPDMTTQAATGYVTRHNPFVYFHSLLDLGDCQANDVDVSHLTDDFKTAKTTPDLAFIAPALDTDPNAFLQAWVPQILASSAYRKDGALLIAFLSGPAGTAPTGALLLSRWAKPGSLYANPYDPSSLLRVIDDLYALDPLGSAKNAKSFARLTLPNAFPPL